VTAHVAGSVDDKAGRREFVFLAGDEGQVVGATAEADEARLGRARSPQQKSHNSQQNAELNRHRFECSRGI
jgi:hypothetical protein